MRFILLMLLSLSTAVTLAAQESRVEEVGKSPVEAKFVAGGELRMDLCSSGIEVVGEDAPVVRVSYESRRDTGDVKVRIEVKGQEADLRVTGCPHNNFQVRVEVPKASDLYVRMMAGQLDIGGITGNKDVELHFGQLTMDVGAASDYRHVTASVNSGDLQGSAFGVSKGGLFRSFDQYGPGKYKLRAHVGAGQLELR
jgi:hypothetical protein